MTKIAINEKLKRNYDDYYLTESISEWRQIGADRKAENIIALCQPYPHSTIVEIGAGDGSILKRLSESSFGVSYWALDISSSAIPAISKKGIQGLREALRFDGYDVPYQNNQFDLVVLSHVIEHVEYPRKLLYEAARIARYVFVEVPLEDNFRLKQDFVWDEVGHINSYNVKTIRRLIQSCSMKVLKQTVTNRSKASYEYIARSNGYIKFIVKESLLRVFPSIAPKLLTYHSSLICAKAESNLEGIQSGSQRSHLRPPRRIRQRPHSCYSGIPSPSLYFGDNITVLVSSSYFPSYTLRSTSAGRFAKHPCPEAVSLVVKVLLFSTDPSLFIYLPAF
jgi:ubiquinone/menaquinone biosynthesis C-methylase UbiE